MTAVTTQKSGAHSRGWVTPPLLVVLGCALNGNFSPWPRSRKPHSQEWLCHLLLRSLRFVHDDFLELLHFGIGADSFAHGGVRELHYLGRRHELGVSLRIVNRDFYFQRVMGRAADAFDEVQRVAVQIAALMQPSVRSCRSGP